jgi:putative ABC transport system substrate-binding protein
VLLLTLTAFFAALAPDLPVDEASKFDFVVNLRTARALGLSPTTEFLARADEVIE